jgi:hypothetical protein
VGILNRQWEKLNLSSKESISANFGGATQKYEKFALGQVNILQDSLKYLNEESAKVSK